MNLFNSWLLRKPEIPTQLMERVCVLIPVRNEENNVAELISSLKNQEFLSDMQVIFIDDSSTDDSYQQIAKTIQADARFELISAPALPQGWLGKPWALQQGFARSHGKYIVTLDADVRLEPTAISQGVAILIKNHFDFASPYPRQLAFTWAERLIQPLLQWSWLSTVPLRIAEKSALTSLAVANGQFFILNRAALLTINGFESIKHEVLDDMKLARQLIKGGFHGSVVDGSGLARTRMYSSFNEIRAGYGKSLWCAFGGKFGSLVAILLLLLTGIAPVVIAITSVRNGWLPLALIILSRAASAARSRGRIFDSILHPLSALLLIYLIIYSWSVRGRIQWKGRTV